MTQVFHLIDDRTAGGVTRMLDFLTTLPELGCDQRVADFKDWRKEIATRPDVIVSHVSISWRKLPTLMTLRAICSNARLIHVEHSYTRAFAAQNVPNRARFLGLLRASYALFDRVVAVSTAQATWLKERNLVSADALHAVDSAVDLAPFGAVPAAPVKPITLGLIGRLDRQKGFDVAIKAFRALPNPDLRLQIYGKGPEEDHLKALSGADPRITFCGHTQTPAEAYAAVDAILMPSRWEAFGLVASEAIAAGRPILAAAVDGLMDQGGDGVEFVRGHTPAHWSERLNRFCETPRNLAPLAPAALDARKSQTLQSWRRLLTNGI